MSSQLAGLLPCLLLVNSRLLLAFLVTSRVLLVCLFFFAAGGAKGTSAVRACVLNDGFLSFSGLLSCFLVAFVHCTRHQMTSKCKVRAGYIRRVKSTSFEKSVGGSIEYAFICCTIQSVQLCWHVISLARA
jgi:hypothetical protein